MGFKERQQQEQREYAAAKAETDRHWLENHCGLLEGSSQFRAAGWGCQYEKGHDGRHSWQDPMDYWAPRLEKALLALTEKLG